VLWRLLTGIALSGAYIYAFGLYFLALVFGGPGPGPVSSLAILIPAFLTSTAAGLIVAVRIVLHTRGAIWHLVLGVASLAFALLLLLAVTCFGVVAAKLLRIEWGFPVSVLLLVASLAILNRLLRRRWPLARTFRPIRVTS
jgi:hypothetical protein